jgi:DNA-directed RNA polymerase beta subunit
MVSTASPIVWCLAGYGINETSREIRTATSDDIFCLGSVQISVYAASVVNSFQYEIFQTPED